MAPQIRTINLDTSLDQHVRQRLAYGIGGPYRVSQFRREGHVVLVGRDAYATLVSAECVPGSETVSQYLLGFWGRVVGVQMGETVIWWRGCSLCAERRVVTSTHQLSCFVSDPTTQKAGTLPCVLVHLDFDASPAAPGHPPLL